MELSNDMNFNRISIRQYDFSSYWTLSITPLLPLCSLIYRPVASLDLRQSLFYFLIQVAISPTPPNHSSPNLPGRWQIGCSSRLWTWVYCKKDRENIQAVVT